MADEAPVLDTLTDITAVSLDKCNLDPREFMMARIAALAAVDASAASYLLNTPSAMDSGVTVEDVQGILIAVAPVVGTPRVLSAAGLWVAFAVMLVLRYGYHLRGRRVAQLTIVAFILLVCTLATSHTVTQGGSP